VQGTERQRNFARQEYVLIEDFILAIDKRQIMLDYYHNTGRKSLSVEGIRRKRADT
jgi:hypothetical protein